MNLPGPDEHHPGFPQNPAQYSSRGDAFTIMELLVAMAVLAIVMVMLTQVITSILQSTSIQYQQMESVAAARRALDVMGMDVEAAVIGPSSTMLVPDGAGQGMLALVTSRRGPATTADHRFLAVAYATNGTNQLLRTYKSVGFDQPDLMRAAAETAGTPTPTDTPLAGGILAIQVRALADGTNSYVVTEPATGGWATNNYNDLPVPSGFKAIVPRSATFTSSGTNRVHAIEVWIAALDRQNFQLLSERGDLATTQALFGPDPREWRTAIDSSALPPQLKSGIRILSKAMPLR